MKVFFLFVTGMVFLLFQAQAQQPDSIQTNYAVSAKKPTIINLQSQRVDGFNYWEEEFRGHWSGIYLGVNGFTKTDYSNYLPEENGFLDVNLLRSNSLNINLIQFSQGLQRTRKTIGLVTGLGMEIQTYHLDQNTSFVKEYSRIEPVELYFEDNQKSKFSSTYLSVPLLIEFQIPVKHHDNPIYFSAGITASKRLSTHTKIKYRKNNHKQKLKSPDDFHLRDFRYSGTVQLGYRWINLFATYDLRPLFEDAKGPEVYPFSFGVSLISF